MFYVRFVKDTVSRPISIALTAVPRLYSRVQYYSAMQSL